MAKPKVYPCLWFDGNAEEAANFYATLVADSHIAPPRDRGTQRRPLGA